MKRFFAIIITVLLIAAIIFCVHSCTKDTKPPVEEEQSGTPGLELYVPEDDPNTEEDESAPTRFPIISEDDSPVYTGVGIYHGKVDSNAIEITLDGIQPLLISARISPELAEKFPSLSLEEDSIISFEYQIINEMYVIQKIIK